MGKEQKAQRGMGELERERTWAGLKVGNHFTYRYVCRFSQRFQCFLQYLYGTSSSFWLLRPTWNVAWAHRFLSKPIDTSYDCPYLASHCEQTSRRWKVLPMVIIIVSNHDYIWSIRRVTAYLSHHGLSRIAARIPPTRTRRPRFTAISWGTNRRLLGGVLGRGRAIVLYHVCRQCFPSLAFAARFLKIRERWESG